jgi:hypothetical protein
MLTVRLNNCIQRQTNRKGQKHEIYQTNFGTKWYNTKVLWNHFNSWGQCSWVTKSLLVRGEFISWVNNIQLWTVLEGYITDYQV